MIFRHIPLQLNYSIFFEICQQIILSLITSLSTINNPRTWLYFHRDSHFLSLSSRFLSFVIGDIFKSHCKAVFDEFSQGRFW